MKLAARFLTAMAIVSLAIMYIATRDQLPDASAATGTINALNVGTCYATDKSEFKKSDCMDGGDAAYDVAGRKDITDAEMLYATYAVDPRTSAESPRAILFNSDLVRISIKDQGRDKRTGVLYGVGDATRVATLNGLVGTNGDDAASYDNYLDRITAAVGVQSLGALYTAPVTEDLTVTPQVMGVDENLVLSSTNTGFDVAENTAGHITVSGDRRIRLVGSENTANPIAPINDDDGHGLKLGRVKFFGFLQNNTLLDTPPVPLSLVPTADTQAFKDISSHLELDEDYGCKTNPQSDDPDEGCANRAPWVRVGANVPMQSYTVICKVVCRVIL